MFLLSAGLAHAFCGTYVAAPGASLTNHSSRVVVARSGTRTTLTLAADYSGDTGDFALLLPIPEIIGPEDVSTGDPSLIEWIDQYSTPRAVAYTCEDFFDLQKSGPGCGYTFGCSSSELASPTFDAGPVADDSVTVESSFTTAGYEFTVLSAEESSDLFGWLQAHDYELARGGDDILQEYIDAGVYFLAVKVAADAASGHELWLPPIRIAYDADSWGLPIRIGTISADGAQEVLIYTLTDVATDGEVGIANYPEAAVDSECMWLGEDAEDMTAWYGTEVATAVAEAGGAAWIKEYSADLVPTPGVGYHCDPCTADPAIPGGTFAPFGLDSDRAHLTRIRMRYDATTATQDLTLYASGIPGASSQLRYIGYEPELEFAYPLCDVGWVENPGECPNEYVAGCTAPAKGSALGLLAAILLLRRRSA